MKSAALKKRRDAPRAARGVQHRAAAGKRADRCFDRALFAPTIDASLQVIEPATVVSFRGVGAAPEFSRPLHDDFTFRLSVCHRYAPLLLCVPFVERLSTQ